MFFKKKKVENKIDSKFKVGETVRFSYHNESYIGTISKAYMLEEKIVYDIMVGGECPWSAHKINEININIYKSLY